MPVIYKLAYQGLKIKRNGGLASMMIGEKSDDSGLVTGGYMRANDPGKLPLLLLSEGSQKGYKKCRQAKFSVLCLHFFSFAHSLKLLPKALWA
jgi:hypothetical protein